MTYLIGPTLAFRRANDLGVENRTVVIDTEDGEHWHATYLTDEQLNELVQRERGKEAQH